MAVSWTLSTLVTASIWVEHPVEQVTGAISAQIVGASCAATWTSQAWVVAKRASGTITGMMVSMERPPSKATASECVSGGGGAPVDGLVSRPS